MKVKLMDIIKRRDELDDRLTSLDHMEQKKVLDGWPGIEGQFYEDVRKEWKRELENLDMVLNTELSPRELENIMDSICPDTIKLFLFEPFGQCDEKE